MKANVYIDGREGTTGLQIYYRLSGRGDINLLLIDHGIIDPPILYTFIFVIKHKQPFTI